MKHQIVVRATWDAEAQVWVATSDDIKGLAIEAATVELLEQKVVPAIQDLIDLNGTRFRPARDSRGNSIYRPRKGAEPLPLVPWPAFSAS